MKRLDDIRINRRRFLLSSAAFGAATMAGLGSGASLSFANDQLRVGWVRPLTGRLTSAFAPLFVGGQVAVEEINAAGGILGREIVMQEEDDEGSPARQPAVIRKLDDNNVDFVVGPVGSSQALASMQATTTNKMLQAAFAQAAEAGDGMKYPYHYQIVVNTDQQARLICDYAANNLKGKKIGILRENTAFGEQGTDATIRILKEYGLEPSTVEVYPLDAPSMDPYINNLRNADTDVLVSWVSVIANAAMAFNTMKTMDWFPPVVGHNGILTDALLDLVPKEVLDNVVVTFPKAYSYTEGSELDPRRLAYAKKIDQYPEAEGHDCNVAAAPFYDFLHILKHVAEAEQTLDPVKLKPAFDSLTNYDGMMGRISFTPENHSGISLDQMTLVSVGSGLEERSVGFFRKRVIA